jgi:hypothetical protein
MLCQTPPAERPDEVRDAGAPARIVATLRRRLSEETDELVKAGHLFAIAALADEDRAAMDALRQQLASPSSPVVELAAAMCLADRDDAAPIEAIDVLAGSLTNGNETQDLFDSGEASVERRHYPLFKGYERAGFPLVETVGDDYDSEDAGSDEDFRFPWLHWEPRFEVIRRLCRVPGRSLDRILPALLSALRDESPHTVDHVSGPILRSLFGGGKLSSGASHADLTRPQRAALEILIDHEALFDPSNGNCKSVFRSVGLPESRWKWERLLDRPGWQAHTVEQILANLDRFVRHSAKMPASIPLTGEDRKRLSLLNLDEIVDADAYIPYLSQFPNLGVLRLCASGITDQGLQAMPVLSRLKRTYLYGNPITDEGVVVLGRVKTLEVLYVNKTGITDRGVKTLAETLPGLRQLSLIATAITDAAVPWLARLTQLEELNIGMTSVSGEALDALRRSLPNCKVWPRV